MSAESVTRFKHYNVQSKAAFRLGGCLKSMSTNESMSPKLHLGFLEEFKKPELEQFDNNVMFVAIIQFYLIVKITKLE